MKIHVEILSTFICFFVRDFDQYFII